MTRMERSKLLSLLMSSHKIKIKMLSQIRTFGFLLIFCMDFKLSRSRLDNVSTGRVSFIDFEWLSCGIRLIWKRFKIPILAPKNTLKESVWQFKFWRFAQKWLNLNSGFQATFFIWKYQTKAHLLVGFYPQMYSRVLW